MDILLRLLHRFTRALRVEDGLLRGSYLLITGFGTGDPPKPRARNPFR